MEMKKRLAHSTSGGGEGNAKDKRKRGRKIRCPFQFRVVFTGRGDGESRIKPRKGKQRGERRVLGGGGKKEILFKTKKI